MAKKEYDLWIEKFKRECGIKSAIILFGNTSDIMMNTYNQGTYMPVINSVISCLRSQKYKVTKWDRVDGIDNALSDKIADIGVSVLQSKNDYDMKMTLQTMKAQITRQRKNSFRICFNRSEAVEKVGLIYLIIQIIYLAVPTH